MKSNNINIVIKDYLYINKLAARNKPINYIF